MKNIVLSAAALIAFSWNSPANAVIGSLSVPDASAVLFQVDAGGRVYFRNLNAFNSTWAGCCTNFWMDITTDVGRAQYATFLSAYHSKSSIMFYADNAGGTFNHVGKF